MLDNSGGNSPAPFLEIIRPLEPSPALLCKLGSIAVHCEELLSPHGHEFDRAALGTLFADHEVRTWLFQMDALAMLPVKRNKP